MFIYLCRCKKLSLARWKANVLINNSGQPLLSDFGLAVIVEDLTQMPISSALEGSGNPRWMAPELFLGQEIVSKASDVWSLGMFYLEVSNTYVVPDREMLILKPHR